MSDIPIFSPTPFVTHIFTWEVKYSLERFGEAPSKTENYDTKSQAMNVAMNIAAQEDCVFVSVARRLK